MSTLLCCWGSLQVSVCPLDVYDGGREGGMWEMAGPPADFPWAEVMRRRSHAVRASPLPAIGRREGGDEG